MTERRKKINVNRYETLTDTELRRASEEFGARVCPKVRVADALEISRSGLSNELYGYALRAHFDFVVVGEDGRVAFAVEFDEEHHGSDLNTIRRDQLKNSICRSLGMPLLRISDEYLDEVGFESPWPDRRSFTARRFSSIVGWLTQLWFLEEAFYKAQERGEVPPDEPFIWSNLFDYDPVIHARGYILSLYQKGFVSSLLPEVTRTRQTDGYWCALAVIELNNDEFVAGYARCFSINFSALSAWELCEELAVLSAAKKLRNCLSGEAAAYRLGQIERWKERLAPESN